MKSKNSKRLKRAVNCFRSFRFVTVLVCFFSTAVLFAQNSKLTGVVVDESGEPIIGASVYIKGTKTGIMTDVNGTFALNAPDKSTLTISYVGYTTQDVVADAQKKLFITLKESINQLDELVVVGFGTQKKVNLTGAVSAIDSKIIENRPVSNVVQALQGAVPGLNISNTNGGMMGTNPSISIRGLGTIGQGSSGSPLVLIDGMEGDINTLNPQDVENISVLKDAASSAIYGSRAPFGVILVTTKKGKKGKPVITYDGSFRSNKPISLPEMADSYSFALFYNDMERYSGEPQFFTPEWLQRIKDFQDGKIPMNTYNGKQYPMTTIVDPANPERWASGYAAGNDNVDVFKTIYKPRTFAHEHNLALSGGSNNVSYYLSGNYLEAPGMMKLGGDTQDRIGVTAKINTKITNWLSLSYIGKFIRARYEQPSSGKGRWEYRVAAQGWPMVPVYDPNGYIFDSPSPYMEIVQAGREKNINDRMSHQFNVTLEPIKGWRIIGDYNFNLVENLRHYDRQQLFIHDVAGNPVMTDGNSYVDESFNRSNYYNANVYTEYSKEISGHYFKVLVGYQFEMLKYRTLGANRTGLILTENPTLNATSGIDQNGQTVAPGVSGGLANWATAGYFGRVNYDYKGRYLFEANLRYDGTSRFQNKNKWNLLPSVSLGWNVARERFWEDYTQYVGNFKIRGSYGSLGNQNTNAFYPTYSVMGTAMAAGNWLINGVKPNIASAPSDVNEYLTWEKIRTYDVGVDLSFLNNRLTTSFDYFIRYTNNMIGPSPKLPAVYGLSGDQIARANNTDMKTQGFDFEIAWQDRLSNGLSYNVRFTLSDAISTILKYPNNPTHNIGYANQYEGSIYYTTFNEGERYGNIWGYTTVGMAKTQEEMDAHLASLPNGGQTALLSGKENSWGAGDIMYADINGDGKIDAGSNTLNDPGDRSVIGNITPRFNFGLDLGAEWKGIDLRLFFQGVMKRDYFNQAYMFWGAGRSMWESTVLKQHLDYFRDDPEHPLGLNMDAYYPRPSTPEIWDYAMGKNRCVQTRYLQNAAYIRLKNLTVGYTLPKVWTNKIKLEKVRVYLSGENLWTGTKLTKIFDPETIDNPTNASYPLNKTYSVGISVTI
ncbi:TonB-dependent receptor [Barnesiella propionica]|uniref:SusC/RagA family TonB-linked outer membrane protein n=1 Tax=Barnesiella propionica TaxID=2981781 RepID=UPI0011CB5656|nr:TonB-dependent receptor [Barnesiella propionica]MCU6767470.1 TonB-dependent receptor [Barnesiella propionica]